MRDVAIRNCLTCPIDLSTTYCTPQQLLLQQKHWSDGWRFTSQKQSHLSKLQSYRLAWRSHVRLEHAQVSVAFLRNGNYRRSLLQRWLEHTSLPLSYIWRNRSSSWKWFADSTTYTTQSDITSHTSPIQPTLCETPANPTLALIDIEHVVRRHNMFLSCWFDLCHSHPSNPFSMRNLLSCILNQFWADTQMSWRASSHVMKNGPNVFDRFDL